LQYNGTLSLMTPDPTSQATQQALDATSTAISLASYSPEAGESLSVEPLGTVQVWQANASAMEETLYCGYRQAFCYGSTQTNAYTNAYDFSGTEPANDSFAMTLYYNSTDRYPGGGNAPTTVVGEYNNHTCCFSLLVISMVEDYSSIDFAVRSGSD
jgi:hypothetical protein